jgi:hypothetical protein
MSTPVTRYSHPWAQRIPDRQATNLSGRRVEDSGMDTPGPQWQHKSMESLVNLTENFESIETCTIGTNTDWSALRTTDQKIGTVNVERKHVRLMCKPENRDRSTQVKTGTKTVTKHCQTDTPSVQHRYTQSKKVVTVNEATSYIAQVISSFIIENVKQPSSL